MSSDVWEGDDIQAGRTPWSKTRSGVWINLLDPHPLDITFADIAYSLAGINRFNGQTRYSVAQHSVDVAIKVFLDGRQADTKVAANDALAGLLHDSAEAYVGDLVRPLKSALPKDAIDAFNAIDSNLTMVIFDRFAVVADEALWARIKEADDAAVKAEMEREFDHFTSEAWDPRRAEEEFLWAFRYFDGLRRGEPAELPRQAAVVGYDGVRSLAGIGETQKLPDVLGD